MNILTDEMIEEAVKKTGAKLTPGICNTLPDEPGLPPNCCILGAITLASGRIREGEYMMISDMSEAQGLSGAYGYGVAAGFDGCAFDAIDYLGDEEKTAEYEAGYEFGVRWWNRVKATEV